MRNKSWNYEENTAIAEAYALMAVLQLSGNKFNKSQLIRTLRGESQDVDAPLFGQCAARSRGSIEAKLMNCSAVALEFGLCAALENGYVKGYKPAPNYQKVLREFLIEALNQPYGFAHTAKTGMSFQPPCKDLRG
jgi:hypothetical protein